MYTHEKQKHMNSGTVIISMDAISNVMSYLGGGGGGESATKRPQSDIHFLICILGT